MPNKTKPTWPLPNTTRLSGSMQLPTEFGSPWRVPYFHSRNTRMRLQRRGRMSGKIPEAPRVITWKGWPTGAFSKRTMQQRHSRRRREWLRLITKSGTILGLYSCGSVEPTTLFSNSKRLQELIQRSRIRIINSLSYMRRKETNISREGSGPGTSFWLTKRRRSPKPAGLIAREITCSTRQMREEQQQPIERLWI